MELTAGPAPRLKTIKSEAEIGRSPAVTGDSGSDAGDCKFPLHSPWSLEGAEGAPPHSRTGLTLIKVFALTKKEI